MLGLCGAASSRVPGLLPAEMYNQLANDTRPPLRVAT